jgi:hypothetical protein
MSQIVPEFPEVLLAQHLRFSAVGASGHTGRILHCSLFLRPQPISAGSLLRKAGSSMTLPAPNARKHDFGTRCGSLRLSHDAAVPFPHGNPKSGIEERRQAH